jgi:hypothetical protein
VPKGPSEPTVSRSATAQARQRATAPYLRIADERASRAPAHRNPDLAPMRGLVYGVVLGALFWSVIVALVLMAVIR